MWYERTGFALLRLRVLQQGWSLSRNMEYKRASPDVRQNRNYVVALQSQGVIDFSWERNAEVTDLAGCG